MNGYETRVLDQTESPQVIGLKAICEELKYLASTVSDLGATVSDLGATAQQPTSVSSCEIKRNSKGDAEWSVKVYCADALRAVGEAQRLYDELALWNANNTRDAGK